MAAGLVSDNLRSDKDGEQYADFVLWQVARNLRETSRVVEQGFTEGGEDGE